MVDRFSIISRYFHQDVDKIFYVFNLKSLVKMTVYVFSEK